MTIEQLLRNWAHWVVDRPHYGHCYSIEHCYRPPQIWYPPGPRIIVDVREALRVERTMRLLPRQHCAALKFAFVYRAPAAWCAHRLAIPYRDWDGFLHDAMDMVKNLLTRDEKRYPIRTNSTFRAFPETLAA